MTHKAGASLFEVAANMKLTRTYRLALLLCACGNGQLTFNLSADTTPQDRTWLEQAIEGINTNLGCERIVLDESTRVYTSRDTLTDAFIIFSNDSYAATELKNRGQDILGVTAYAGNVEPTDIYLTSMVNWTMPEPTCQAYAPDATERSYCSQYAPPGPQPYQMEIMVDVHELGHAQGLAHTTNPDDIMFASIGSNNVHPEGITTAQWQRYVAQVKAQGFVCPAKGYN